MTTNTGTTPRWLFILSTERSGSTLLSILLGAHSSVISPPELHLLAYPTFDDWRRHYPTAMKSLGFLLASCGLKMDEKQIEDQFAGWPTESLYGWISAQRVTHAHSSIIIIDKTPKYARELTTLQRTAKLDPWYIWLIRHPLGVATSQINLRLEDRRRSNARFRSRLTYPLFRARAMLNKHENVRSEVAYWMSVNTVIDQFLTTIQPERKHRVHFEQLVKEPRTVMESLCLWLDIQFEASMLDPHGHIPNALDVTLGDPKVRRHSSIDPMVADSWRKICSEKLLDSSRKRRLGVTPRDLMARWGIK